MKKIHYIIIIMLSNFALKAEKDSHPQQLIENVFIEFKKQSNWKSTNAAVLLTQIIKDYPNSVEARTAKFMMICHYQSLDKEKSLREAEQLCKNLIASNSNTWQAEMARFNLVSIYGLQGKREEQANAAKETLSKINIQLLQDSTDEYFIRLKNIFPLNTGDIREALKMMLGSAYAETGRLVEAEQVLKTITNKEFADLVKQSINYQKEIPKMKEREKQRMKK